MLTIFIFKRINKKRTNKKKKFLQRCMKVVRNESPRNATCAIQ